MKSSLTLWAAMGLAWPAAAAAKPAPPQAFLPTETMMVAHWKNPAATLTRVEALARSAGMAPPGAKAGWLVQSLAAEQPWLAEVDLTQPIWVAAAPTKGGKKDEPKITAVFAVKGKGAEVKKAFVDMGPSERRGQWQVVTSGAELPAIAKKPFTFPTGTGELQSSSDIVAYLDVSALPLDELDLGTAGQADLRQRMKALDFAETMTLGLGLADSGASLLIQQHPKPGSPMAKLGAAAKNTEAPLVTGLPPADYALLVGTRSSPAYTRGYLSTYGEAIASAVAEEDPELGVLVRDAIQTIGASKGDCEGSAYGVVLPPDLASAFFVGRGRCKDAPAAEKSWGELVDILNRGIRVNEKREGEKLGFSFATVGPPREVSGAKLVPLGLVADKGSSALDDAPDWARSPLLHGSVDKRNSVMAWNAPTSVLTELVGAAKSGRAPPMTAFRATQAALISPRMTEGYLRIGPVVASFLPPELAPMSVLLSVLPPIGFAAKTFPDGSSLTQVWLPNQLAQLVAAGVQMANARGGPGSGPTDEAPPPRKKKSQGI